MSESDFTTHATDEFTEEDDCEDGVICMTQPFEPNDFVLLESETQKPMKYVYFVDLNQEIEPDGYDTRFLEETPTCCIFYLLDYAVVDLIGVVLMLLQPVVSRKNRKSL
jgi:hypothetical protein